MAPETACPRGGSSACDILCFGTDGDVKTVMSGRLAREEICGDRGTPSNATSRPGAVHRAVALHAQKGLALIGRENNVIGPAASAKFICWCTFWLVRA